MGCATSNEAASVEATGKSKAIDRQLKLEKVEHQRFVKLLLLGSGESGKSTVLKQMKMIYGTGFTKDELLDFRNALLYNLVECAQTLVKAMETLQIPYQRAEREYIDIMEDGEGQGIYNGGDYGFMAEHTIDPTVLEAIKTMWEDSGIQYCYSRRNEFQLQDSCAYILNNMARITSPDFIPSEADILNTRVMTLGVSETKLNVEGVPYKIFDFGGQRAERKKWAGYFEDVTTVLFLVAISSYDQSLYEDSTTNRMVESLNVFSSVCNHQVFKKTGFILFLNKIDLFKEKLKTSSIMTYFPDFTEANTFELGSKYFLNRFQSLNQFKNRPVYIHLTWATDRKQISVILKLVHACIAKSNLEKAGFA
ncbi:G protein alpha subunit [Obelidium mucronatum]|nr:G protein alpha subunit [Obelidium mucronatum]